MLFHDNCQNLPKYVTSANGTNPTQDDEGKDTRIYEFEVYK